MNRRVLLLKPAEKAFLALDPGVQKRVVVILRGLGTNPYPPGSIKLQGEEDLYRVRVGDWRIIYTVRDDELLVLVVKIGHRGDVYRKR